MGLKLTQSNPPSKSWGLWSTTVLEFQDSGFEMAEVELEGRDPLRATRSLHQAIKYAELSAEIKSVKRGARVWLARRT